MTAVYLVILAVGVGVGLLMVNAIHNDFASCKNERERKEKERDYFEWYIIAQIINEQWKGGGENGD